MIHCIGDSHCLIFNNIKEYCESHYIGIPTATYIKNYLNAIDTIISNVDKEKDYILFTPGEIDCRVFFETRITYYENSGLTGKDLEDNKNNLVIKIVNQYFNILHNRYKEYKLIFWGPVASYREDLMCYYEKVNNQMPDTVKNMPFEEVKKYYHPDPDFFMPGNHTCKERNLITKLFNDELNKICVDNNRIFLTMFYDMIDENMITKYEMTDGIIHLNDGTIPLIIEKFKNKIPI
jgi:hypothetical protein